MYATQKEQKETIAVYKGGLASAALTNTLLAVLRRYFQQRTSR
jgi:hypothetical protein